jgi:hypothetical protein
MRGDARCCNRASRNMGHAILRVEQGVSHCVMSSLDHTSTAESSKYREFLA